MQGSSLLFAERDPLAQTVILPRSAVNNTTRRSLSVRGITRRTSPFIPISMALYSSL